jgi:hypothetical protein
MNHRRSKIAAAAFVLAFAFACTPHAPAGVKELTPEQAAPLISSGARPVDVNMDSFRKENGVLANAVILSSSSKYAMDELPADRASQLVFYCSNRL